MWLPGQSPLHSRRWKREWLHKPFSVVLVNIDMSVNCTCGVFLHVNQLCWFFPPEMILRHIPQNLCRICVKLPTWSPVNRMQGCQRFTHVMSWRMILLPAETHPRVSCCLLTHRLILCRSLSAAFFLLTFHVTRLRISHLPNHIASDLLPTGPHPEQEDWFEPHHLQVWLHVQHSPQARYCRTAEAHFKNQDIKYI